MVHLFNTLIQSQVLSTLHQEHVLLLVISSNSDPLWLPNGAQHQHLVQSVYGVIISGCGCCLTFSSKLAIFT